MKAILFPFFFLSLLAISCSVSTGKKTTKLTFNGGELLYTDAVTEAQAKALGNYLVENKFYNGDPKTVQLDKENGIIQFSMVLNDSLANSAEYQTMGAAFVQELEQNVFKGSTVEVNYCDEYMKPKKKIKGDANAMVNNSTTDATPVSDNSLPEEFQFIRGYWLCSNITGGDVDAAKQAHDLPILQSNFSFDIKEDGTFTSNFINQNDLENPVPIKGHYAISNQQIDFTGLQINGQPTDQKMSFEIKMPIADQLQLISHEAGKADMVMSFERQQ